MTDRQCTRFCCDLEQRSSGLTVGMDWTAPLSCVVARQQCHSQEDTGSGRAQWSLASRARCAGRETAALHCLGSRPPGQGRHRACSIGWKQVPQTQCLMTVLPALLSVLEFCGQDLHCRLSVVFWKVLTGHLAEKRVRLLQQNLPVSQARHTSLA